MIEARITFHYPHNRFCLGWEILPKDKEFNYATFRLFLLIVTIDIDFDNL